MKRLLAVVVLGAVLAPTLAAAQPAPVVVMPVEETYLPVHQLQLGLGFFACAFSSGAWGSGSACIADDFLIMSIPVVYRYRINDYLAAGGGAMIHVFSLGEYGTLAGGELMGSFRAYAVPDWLYFEANVLFGFPLWFSVMPTVGVSIPLGFLSIYFENQFPLWFFGDQVTGFWQPVLGVELFF
jgi:hypothetical protein